MGFEDAVLVRLATDATRDALLGPDSLARIASAAYRTEQLPLDAPYSAVFDQLSLANALDEPLAAQARWTGPDGAPLGEARVELDGWRAGPLASVDALWGGAVVARTASGQGKITAVAGGAPDLAGIDAAIVTALGALPADAAALEQARRDQLLAQLRALAQNPDLVPSSLIDRLLADAGVDSVSALLSAGSGAGLPMQMRLSFGDLAPVFPVPTPLPIAAAILIRDPARAGFALAGLLAESKRVQRQLQAMGWTAAADPRLPQRHAAIIVWLTPDTWFDDPDWPGATDGASAADQRLQRLSTAGAWLAREGIGIAAIAHPPN